MHEGEDLPGTTVCNPAKVTGEEAEEIADDEGFSSEVKKTDDYKKFMLLKRVKKDKEKDENSAKAIHTGYKVSLIY